MNRLVVSGKRKSAVAKATIVDGNGNISINQKPLSFLTKLQQFEIYEPLIIAKEILGELKFDISVNVRGGGSAAQIESSRLAIAKAIVEFTKEENVKNAFLAYDRNLLIADTRRKEPCKPGDSKARSMRQSSKR